MQYHQGHPGDCKLANNKATPILNHQNIEKLDEEALESTRALSGPKLNFSFFDLLV